MGSTTVAVDTLDRLAVQLAGIQEAAQQLRDIGSFQDAIADLTKQRDRLLADVGAAKSKQTAQLDEHLKAVDQVKRDAAELTAQAKTAMRDAKAKANAILTEAAEQAALDLKADRENRETVLKDLQDRIEVEKQKLADLIVETKQATQEAIEVERRVVDATIALEQVQADARKLIGG